MTIVDNYNIKDFDGANFEMQQLLNRIVTLENNMNKTLAALPSPDDYAAAVNDLQAQLTAAIQNAQQGQAGVETRMADLEVNHDALRKQIVDTAEALKKAPQDILVDVITAVSADPAIEVKP